MAIHSIAIKRMAQATYEEAGKAAIESVVKAATTAIQAVHQAHGADTATEWAKAFQGVFDSEADLIEDVLLEIVKTLDGSGLPETSPEEVLGEPGEAPPAPAPVAPPA